MSHLLSLATYLKRPALRRTLLCVALLTGLLLGCNRGSRAERAAQQPPTPPPAISPSTSATGTQIALPLVSATRREVPPTPTPSSTERLAAGQTLHRFGDYAAARAEFEALLDDDPSADLRPQALFELARAQRLDGLASDALATLDELDDALPSANFNAERSADLTLRSRYLRALALTELGEFDAAVSQYNILLRDAPWMAAELHGQIADVRRTVANWAGAAESLRAAVDAETRTLPRVQGLEALAEVYLAVDNPAAAAAAYDEILAIAQNPDYRATILYRAGNAYDAAGDETTAIASWRAATESAPADNAAYLSLVALVEREAEFDLFQRGYIDILAGAWFPAISAFEAYIDEVGPNGPRADEALHFSGQAHLAANNYAEAIDIFDRVIEEYPNCVCFGQAWVDKGRALGAAGDVEAAQALFRDFAERYSQNPAGAEALWQSGLLALNAEADGGGEAEAAVDWLLMVEQYPASPLAPRALYTLGVGAFERGLTSITAEMYGRLRDEYPAYNTFFVRYWLGRALEAEGESEAARAEWASLVEEVPDIYYGLLAERALDSLAAGDPVGSTNGDMLYDIAPGPPSTLAGDDGSQPFAEAWLRSWLAESPAGTGSGLISDAATGSLTETEAVTAVTAASSTTDTASGAAELPADLSALPPEIAGDSALRTARVLLDVDERGAALARLEPLYTENVANPAVLYPLALEFEELGTYRLSLIAARMLIERSPARLVEDAPVFLQKLVYPRRFAELIEREATAQDIDPFVYYSLIRQESLFEEGARSVAAAQGLAQIIPDTGDWIAQQVGYPGYTNELVYRPHINVRFGAYYLNWVRDYLDGNMISALVGYNAGPGNADAWRELSGADDTLYAEVLTFGEPRTYIRSITTNVYHYRRLYGE